MEQRQKAQDQGRNERTGEDKGDLKQWASRMGLEEWWTGGPPQAEGMKGMKAGKHKTGSHNATDLQGSRDGTAKNNRLGEKPLVIMSNKDFHKR